MCNALNAGIICFRASSVQKKQIDIATMVRVKGSDKNHRKVSSEAIVLWRKTVELNPSLVENHGEFSSEILQAMLGIQVQVNTQLNQKPVKDKKYVRERSDSVLSVFEDEFDRIELAYPNASLIECMHRGGKLIVLVTYVFDSFNDVVSLCNRGKGRRIRLAYSGYCYYEVRTCML